MAKADDALFMRLEGHRRSAPGQRAAVLKAPSRTFLLDQFKLTIHLLLITDPGICFQCVRCFPPWAGH